MPEGKSAAADLAEGVKSVFERLSEFFHIFDLSYIVSGITAFGALVFLYLRNDWPREFPFADWVGVVALIVASYICGLLCFEAGRMLNGWLFRGRVMRRAVRTVVEEHGLQSPVVSRYAPTPAGDRSLYTRLWAEVSNNHSGKAVFRHLLRYWVMAATYDGVAAALMLWSGVALACGFPTVVEHAVSPELSVVAFLAFLTAAALAFHRGAGYLEYQLEDLVATLAAAKEPLF